MNQSHFWGGGGAASYSIERSLRFNDDDTASLNRTFGTSTNNQKSTVSFWVKRSNLGSYQHMWHGGVDSGAAGNYSGIRFNPSDVIEILDYQSGYATRLITNAVFRDVSAWYHIVFAIDTTQSTPADRNKLYVNGEQVTSFSSQTNYGSGDNPMFNKSSTAHYIGQYKGSSNLYYFDGYMAEFNFVDGTQLDVTEFGETDTETGAWIPKKYSGSYGTNGFYLSFSDNSSPSALGTDSSGNGNTWSQNNFSVSAGTGNDSLEDTPTNNYCTLNPLNRGVDNPTVDDGNLRYSTSGTDHTVVATFALPSSGKWYWECSKTADTFLMSGIIYDPEIAIGSGLSTYLGGQDNGYSVYAHNGDKYTGAVGNQTYMAATPTSTTVTVAFDADTNKLYFGADGNWGDGLGNTDETFANAAVAFTVPTGKTYYPAISFSSGTAYANFGQRDFDHTPPTGYKALNTANLPVPTIKNGKNHFDILLETGTGSSRSISSLSFQPDFLWAKGRNASSSHLLYDSVRGVDKSLNTNTTLAEDTTAGQLTSFDSNGYTLPNDTAGYLNYSGRTYAFWNWKAGGSSSSNTDGSITSTVSANVDAGFSIVSYTGNGTAGATVGHGLNVAPNMIIVRRRNSGVGGMNFQVYHSKLNNGVTPEDYAIFLNLNNAEGDYAQFWNDTAPTSSVFTLGSSVEVNGSGGNVIAYCFAEVEGFSKFGTYEGNTSINGPYIHTGFSVAWLMVKNIDYGGTNGDWVIHDNKRNPYNVADNHLEANTSNVENGDGRPIDVDFLSNGFKIRTDGSYYENNNSQTYIYMAFAETPFKYANAR